MVQQGTLDASPTPAEEMIRRAELAYLTYDRLRYLEGVERLARELVTSGLELRGNPPALTVIEREDHMDPHWLLCTILHSFPKPQ
jgi:hypothetical protein